MTLMHTFNHRHNMPTSDGPYGLCLHPGLSLRFSFLPAMIFDPVVDPDCQGSSNQGSYAIQWECPSVCSARVIVSGEGDAAREKAGSVRSHSQLQRRHLPRHYTDWCPKVRGQVDLKQRFCGSLVVFESSMTCVLEVLSRQEALLNCRQCV